MILEAESSILLIIDFQARLMPAIHDGDAAVRNARRLMDAARLLDVPYLFTEQNPAGLGHTVPELAATQERVIAKMTFDSCPAPGFMERLDPGKRLVVAGCEAHVCVLQTVLGLRARGREVYLVSDAIGARKPESKQAAIARMARHGVEVVTTEMVIFEWLGSCEHPNFRQAVALVK